jgi:hypothetical protein
MAYDNDLVELAMQINDAIEHLARAETLAAQLAAPFDHQEPDETCWLAMEHFSLALGAILNRLKAAMPEEIHYACAEAEKDLDEMGDRADGLSC